MANSNEYMKNYMKNRREKRRADLRNMLGGSCRSCGTTDSLEFDHIDPSTKSFAIGDKIDKAWSALLAELSKCQLLCIDCHIVKSSSEASVDHGEGKSGKKNCQCSPCRSRKAEYMRAYGHPSR